METEPGRLCYLEIPMQHIGFIHSIGSRMSMILEFIQFLSWPVQASISRATMTISDVNIQNVRHG